VPRVFFFEGRNDCVQSGFDYSSTHARKILVVSCSGLVSLRGSTFDELSGGTFVVVGFVLLNVTWLLVPAQQHSHNVPAQQARSALSLLRSKPLQFDREASTRDQPSESIHCGSGFTAWRIRLDAIQSGDLDTILGTRSVHYRCQCYSPSRM